MSSAGALPRLYISPNPLLPRAPIKYFLNHVKSPRHIEFAPDVKWSAMTLPLLAALAPRSLTLHNGFLHQSVHQMLQDYQKFQTDSLKTVVEFVHPDGLVNFSSLLPTLESLDIKEVRLLTSTEFYGIDLERFVSKFPKTLTHLSLDAGFYDAYPSQWIPQLPQSLTSLRLTLSDRIFLSVLFDRLPLIETLNLYSRDIRNSASTNEVLQIPSSLQELALTTETLPEILLGGTSLIHSNIKSFALAGNYASETIDLLPTLPHGLESLTVSGLLFSDCFLPRSLTSLEWRLHQQPPCFNSMLKQLSALKSLKIIPEETLPWPTWKYSKLDLPSGLQYLYAPLQLSQIIAILDDCPSCVIVSSLRLHLIALDVLNVVQSNPDLLACTEPVFDGPQLIAALDARFKNRVTFRPIKAIQEEKKTNLCWPSVKVILMSDTHLCIPLIALSTPKMTSYFPHVTDLSISYSSPLLLLPPSLTSLDLHDTPLDRVGWSYFPRTLTHLASNSEHSLHDVHDAKPVGMSFKHLNIPHWRLLWSEILADSLRSDMEVLKIGEITDIKDWQVSTFFSKFSTETLRNTFIRRLNYVETGLMTAQYDGIIKDYTIETMKSLARQLFDDALKTLLAVGVSISASPMPDSSMLNWALLAIPTLSEVETIHLRGPKKWRPIAPKSPRICSNDRPFLPSQAFQPIFAFQSDKLKELILENSLLDRCEFPTSWPSSLVRIGLDARTVNDFRFITFPPSLEVLSLRSIKGLAFGVLPFSLEILPTSLKRLTIQSVVAWHPQPTQPLAAGIHRFSLPSNFVSPYNLTLVRFQGLLQDSLEYVFNALSLASATVEFKEDDFHLGVKKLALNHKNVVISTKSRWTHLD